MIEDEASPPHRRSRARGKAFFSGILLSAAIFICSLTPTGTPGSPSDSPPPSLPAPPRNTSPTLSPPTDSPPAASTPTPPRPSRSAGLDKWDLWANGTQLRGANLYQRRVYPELDNGFFGPGPAGPPVTQQDIDNLAALGANYVNLSHPGLFTEKPPYQPDPAMQANLDALLDMIAQADMFAVISFRTGPGRSEFTFFWDEAGTWFDESYLNNSVWADQQAQDAWAEMWAYTAAQYKDNPIVVGYDLMVEPNSNEVGSYPLDDPLDIWDPAAFYDQYGGTLYDWNQLYPDISAAIRAVDTETPILIGGMGYSGVDWLPYLEPTGDPRTVYTVHFYQPFSYTHQLSTTVGITYPGFFDLDYDGAGEAFDRAWLEGRLATVEAFVQAYGVPVAVNEFGLVRWAPGAAAYLHDLMDLFELLGLNHAVWEWQPSWEPLQLIDQFNFRRGADPENHQDVDNALQDAIVAYWARNTLWPSTAGAFAHAVYLPVSAR